MPSWIAYLLAVLFVAAGVAASIALHEVGHLVPAKRFGVKVTQYMVGFGATLWSRRRGETEYGIKAVPLGGYIRMIGMFPPRPGDGGRLRPSSTGRLALMVQSAREDSLLEVSPEDDHRTFYRLSVPKKLVVMLGGPVMNLLIALVLTAVVVSGFGLPQESTRLGSVSRCLLPPGAAADATCSAGDRPAPGAAAGLRPGDRIVAFDGQKINDWQELRRMIRAGGGRQVRLTVQRNGGTLELPATLVATDRPVTDARGAVRRAADGTVVTERVGFLGVTPGAELVPQPLSVVPGYVGAQLEAVFGILVHLPQRMVGVAQAVFGSGPRDPNGPVSVVGVGRLAGEVATSDVAGGVLSDLRGRMATLVGMIASLNLALFAFNLIPLLPLDGGHVAGALWEGVKRTVARLRGRPDPGWVDVAKALPLAFAVAVVMVSMAVLLMLADVVNPIRLTG